MLGNDEKIRKNNMNGASDGNRTRVSSLGSCSSTIELHSQLKN